MSRSKRGVEGYELENENEFLFASGATAAVGHAVIINDKLLIPKEVCSSPSGKVTVIGLDVEGSSRNEPEYIPEYKYIRVDVSKRRHVSPHSIVTIGEDGDVGMRVLSREEAFIERTKSMGRARGRGEYPSNHPLDKVIFGQH